MSVDEFPGNRLGRPKLFLRSFTGQKVQSQDVMDSDIYKKTSHRPKFLYAKWSKYLKKTNAGPPSSQGGKRSLRDIAPITNVDKSTLSKICKCFLSNDDETLEKLLCPSTYKRVAPTLLTSEEEAMLTERKDSLNSLMVQIASDGRPSWKDGVHSEDAIWAFRARHREITFRNAENKDRSKIGEEASVT